MSTLTRGQLATLAEMLTYCRPHGSVMDWEFRYRFLSPLPGVYEDPHGNLITRIGTAPILWSSHTDTVHRTSGRQSVRIREGAGTISLSRRSRRHSSCLGADDTAGVFLMREMILAGVEGLYIFHYGEERGGIGSSALARLSPDTLNGIRFAIALDRAGTTDVITAQMGGRCASDTFAWSLASQLASVARYTPDDTGIYTDTAEYAEIIPECTNLSVGYYHAHSPREVLDYRHLGRLLSALVQIDHTKLICARDPEEDARKQYARFLQYRDTPRATGFDEWCGTCGCPIIADDDYEAMLVPVDRCECLSTLVRDLVDDGEYEALEREYLSTLSEEDRKFLRYLRGL